MKHSNHFFIVNLVFYLSPNMFFLLGLTGFPEMKFLT